MSHRILFTAIIVVYVLLAPHQIYGQEKKELIEAVQAYREQFKNIQFDLHYKDEVLSSDEEKQRQKDEQIKSLTKTRNDQQCRVIPYDPDKKKSQIIRRMEVHIKIKNDLRYQDVRSWNKLTDDQPQHDVIAYDGKVTRKYFSTFSSGSIENGKDPYVSQFDYVAQLMMWPKEAMDKEDPRRIVYDLIAVLEDDKTIVESQTEKVHGVDTVVLNYSNGAMKVWLDLKHGAIVRRVKRVRPDGTIASTYDIPKLQKKGCIFFPEMLKYYTNDTIFGMMMTLSIPGNKLKINEGLEDEEFILQFPPKICVHDLVTGTQYIIKDKERDKGQALDNEVDL